MNILFLTLVEISNIEERGIYQDLLRKFRNEGHSVVVVTPVERRKGISTNFKEVGGVSILQVRTFNIQKTNVFEKGIGTLAIEYQYLSAIKRYSIDTKFDLVLYSTPPITFAKVIEYIKKRDGAKSYLLLKDIFPQNAVDMKMIKEGGFIHKQFVKKERRLYQISDTIGCMSPANVDYILKNNPYLGNEKVHVNPNSIEPVNFDISSYDRLDIRRKYEIPLGDTIFVYGGNLGKPQGLDFLMDTISQNNIEGVYFLIIGDGTEYSRIKTWIEINRITNVKLLQKLNKVEYDKLLSACDVGLIFLHKNFEIPNFPSRLLSYLEMGIPVISATDPNTDIGDVIENAGCGFKVLSGDSKLMSKVIEQLLDTQNRIRMGTNAKKLLLDHYCVDKSYDILINQLQNV